MDKHFRALAQAVGRVPTGWWVVLLTIPALLPLARSGFFDSHDGLLHAYRLAALDRAVRAGVLYPRWFPELAFGYGQPVLHFYGPLSYYWGLPFTLLGADAALATKLVFGTGLLASALGMYLFARLYLNRGAALVSALAYAYLPYHLLDLYVRGAISEFLAFVWFPLALWAVERLISGAGQRLASTVTAALILASLLLTHPLSTLIFAPVLVSYTLALLLTRHSWPPVWRVASALLLAVLLSAFYSLPVLTEARYVGLSYETMQGYRSHLLPLLRLVTLNPAYDYSVAPGTPVTFSVGWLQALLLLLSLALLPWAGPLRKIMGFFLLVALAALFMLATASLTVWQLLERGLGIVQYPWRFQAILALATAFLAGTVCQCLARRLQAATHPWRYLLLGGGLVLIFGGWSLGRLPLVPSAPDLSVEAMWHLDRETGQIGTTWTGEFLPIWVKEQRWAISHPLPEPGGVGETTPPGQVRLVGAGHTRYALEVNASNAEPARVVLHQFHYPGWHARPSQTATALPSSPAGPLGLASFELPVQDEVSIELELGPPATAGTFLSLATALVIGLALVLPRGGRRRKVICRTVPLITCCLLLALVLLGSLIAPNGRLEEVEPAYVNFDNRVELLAFTSDGTIFQPGDTVTVTLYWRSLRPLERDYKVSVALTDASMTRQPAQHDGAPGGGYSPTTRWLPGELVPDKHHVSLPDDLAPGRYRLWATMYEYETVRNLPVISAEAPAADDRVLLGEIQVVAP